MTRTQEITLDVYGTSSFLHVRAKQDDNISRQLVITLTDNGTPIKPDRDTERAVFRVLKPDGHSVLDPADIGEDGRITVVLSNQALACPGKSEADVAIIKGEEVISSAVFFIQVVRAPLGVHLTSENEFLLLVEATRAAEQSAGKADAAAEAANEAAKSADASRRAADEAEALRQEAESKRINDFSDAIRKARDASDAAALSENNAAASAEQAGAYNTEAKSYAVGDTGSREGEDVDNAKYYYDQAKRISQGLAGALLPIGTISFAELKAQSALAGYMYNISDAFITDDTFREGAGHAYPAGTNVYWTAGGEWDCLAGAQVVSVNSKTGAVTLTKEDVGLGNVENVKVDDMAPTFTQAESLENIASGENLPTLFGKIKKWFSDLKTVAFSGKYSDLTGTPTIPAAATDVPKGPGTASAGKGTTWARADHVHPAQTSVTGSSGSCTGNAATATKVSHALTFTGGASGSYDGSTAKSVKIPSTLADLSNGVWKAGDTLTIAAAVASGYFTGSAKRCVIAVPIGKPCSAAGATITTLTGTLRGVGGYVDSSGTNFLKSPYSVSVSIHGNSGLAVIQIDKTTALTDATNNTVAVFNGDIALTFKASADEPMPGPEIFGDDAGVEGPSVTDGAEPAEKEAETV